MAGTSASEVLRVRGFITDLWLVDRGEGLVLLDGGCRGDAERVVRAIVRDLGRSPGELSLAVVTHAHPDHAGGAVVLRRRFGTPIAAPTGIDLWYRGWSGLLQQMVDRQLARHVARRMGRPRESVAFPRRLRPDRWLLDGDQVPGLPGWRVLHLPGHTSHDVLLHSEAEATLYASDLVVRIGDELRLPVPILDRRLTARSIDRLAGLRIRRVLLAHGGEVEVDGADRVVAALHRDLARTPHPAMRWVRLLTRIGRETRRTDRWAPDRGPQGQPADLTGCRREHGEGP